jgi:hypothetical protein
MSARYGQKIIPQKNSSVPSFFKKDRYASEFIRIETPYTRNSSFLSITEPISPEQKIVCLVAVYDTDTNFLSFTIAGAYTVDWGDGVVENFTSGTASHHIYSFSSISAGTETSEGFRQVVVTITPQAANNITSINFRTRHPSTLAANIYSPQILELYVSAPNCTSFTLGNFNTSTAQNLRYLQYAKIVNLSSLANFTSMFGGCFELRKVEIYNSSPTNISNMFAYCYLLTDMNTFNTSLVTNATYMFYSCNSLTTIPDFNWTSVVTFTNVFELCASLVDLPILSLPKATSLAGCFQNCYSLKKVILLNTGSVLSFASTFINCNSLTSINCFDTSSATNASSLFDGCRALVDIPSFNFSKVTNLSRCFANCTSVKTIPNLYTSSLLLNVSSMFNACVNLVKVFPLNTQSVTTVNSLFYGCVSLVEPPFLNTASVTNAEYMFYDCKSLERVPVFNFISALSLVGLFQNCYSLKGEVTISNTQNVTNFNSCFNSCYSLQKINGLNTTSAINITYIVAYCYSLKILPEINGTNVITADYLAYDCKNIIFGSGAPINLSKVITSLAQPIFNSYNLQKNIFTGVVLSINYSNCLLSKTVLEDIFVNLGTARVGATRTLTLTNNWGAPTPVSLTGTTTAGTTTITMASTVGLSAGMQVTGTNTPLTTGRGVTFTDTGDLVNLTAHGLSDGDEVSFSSITSTTGIVINTIYFVVNKTDDSFQVASSVGGSALALTTNGSGTVRYNSTIVSIVPNTSVTMSRPMAGSASQTLAFRLLGTYKAILKGFAVTG